MTEELDFDLGFEDNEETETTEYNEDYNSTEVIENELGETYSREEVNEWTSLVNSAKHLIQTGELSEHNALETIQGVYGEYLKKRDMNEAMREGLKPSDISKEAWELYEKNIGKMTIKQCVDATDYFLDGLLGANRNKGGKRVTKHKIDPFLAGFDSV